MILHTNGLANWAADFFEKNQLSDCELWAKFVDLYRSRPDSKKHGWRGEFWGKMMRGACLVYQYTKSEELYEILTHSVEDMLTTADDDGRVSSYMRDNEFYAWDMWCRKYVILACEYYLDICKDEELKGRIISFLKGCADYILLHVGEGENQKSINDTSGFWFGLNSSSILEPMVKLYRLTKCKKYLDFAAYIVEQGGAKGINIFKLAYENEIYPYQYGVSKAYEMISCFEGLLEYYYETGEEWCKDAVINFANAVADTELSIIGCNGSTHELFDYTSARQTVRQKEVLQETCVTVTWMKFCSRVLELTQNVRFADCIEQSFYNAYLGAINTQGKTSAYITDNYADAKATFLPVDSYSPLLSSKRGLMVGGHQDMPDNSYYGCCACISSAGVGVFLNNMITADQKGITVNFFEEGKAVLEYKGAQVEITQKTNYPTDSKVEICIKTDRPVTFELKVRVPSWAGEKTGYATYEKEWTEDSINLDFDMSIRAQYPIKWEKAEVYTDMSNTTADNYAASPVMAYHKPEYDNYVALMRGPLVLAADSRLGKDADSIFDFEPVGTLCDDKTITADENCIVKMEFTDKKGEKFHLIDYASAGKDWDTVIAAWLKTK